MSIFSENYLSPEVEVVELQVEKGFANSFTFEDYDELNDDGIWH